MPSMHKSFILQVQAISERCMGLKAGPASKHLTQIFCGRYKLISLYVIPGFIQYPYSCLADLSRAYRGFNLSLRLPSKFL